MRRDAHSSLSLSYNESEAKERGMRLEDVTYDFETDQWVAQRLIKARWIDRELPPPVEPPKPGHWIRTPAKGHLRESYYSSIGLTAAIAFTALVYSLVNVINLLTLTSAFVLWIGIPIALCWATRPNQLQASTDDLRLLEDPEDRDTCLVEVVIVRDGEPVGADRGVAWFENGRLLFNGARTSFAIGGEDVLPRRQWASRGGDRRIDTSLS
ncbi:hypothetical protein EON82_24345, partial [bacterium]